MRNCAHGSRLSLRLFHRIPKAPRHPPRYRKLRSYRIWPQSVRDLSHSTVPSLILFLLAWLLNLRGDDIPFNPVFHSYLFISSELAVLFIEPAKITPDVEGYLTSISVTHRDYNDIWSFLRKREWGQGRVNIPPLLPSFIILMPPIGHYHPPDILRAVAHADELSLHCSTLHC